MFALAAALFPVLGCGEATDPDTQEQAILAEFSGLTEEAAASYIPRRLDYPKVISKPQFRAMARDEGVLIQGRSLKFLIDQREISSPRLYFTNAKYQTPTNPRPESAIYHYDFALATLPGFRDSLGTFNQVTYPVQNKRYVAGTIQTYQLGATEPLYGIQLYPEDVASEETILNLVKIVKSKFTIPDAHLAFVSTGPQQTTQTIAERLRAMNIEPMTIDQILGDIRYIPMRTGDAWGYLRIFPTSSDQLTPTDIPVFSELPLDLAVVSGVITKAFQDTNAHVNLKSQERGTPNMVLRDASPSHEALAAWANLPVHLSVRADRFTITASTDAEVQEKYRERTNRPWVPIDWVADSRLLKNSEMCPDFKGDCIQLARGFGTKAANLGLLISKQVLGRKTDEGTLSNLYGYDLAPEGFGVPIRAYHDFVNLPENSALKAKLDLLIADEKAGMLSPSDRIARVSDVQSEFYKAKLPDGTLDALKARLAETLPGVVKIKVRSSANAEDLPNFDGAGLHDSFSANLSKNDNPDGSCLVVPGDDGIETKLEVVPKTLQCAVKAVYASLWNKRAIEERSFARLDHATAGMGIAIVAKYDIESNVSANSVVISRVLGTNNVYGYTFSNQMGNNLVTNPLPGTLSENIVAAFSGLETQAAFVITRYATPIANFPAMTTSVMSNEQMNRLLEITKKVETAYCEAKPTYYSGLCWFVPLDNKKPKAIDMEFKLLANGQFVAKQLREFGGM